jgi:hypothetical protein
MKSENAKKVLIGILVIIVVALAFLFTRANSSQQMAAEQVSALEDSVKRLNNAMAFSNLRNEVLKEINNNLSSQLYTKSYAHVSHETKSISPEAKVIQQLIIDLEQGWVNMMDTKNPDALLTYFLPQFTTNSVKINTENMPFVQRHNNSDFRAHLTQLAATKDLELIFDKPTFYTTMVRGDIFTTNYLSKLTATHQGKVIHKSTILCFVSGEKKNGKWLIGNYNWTRYDDFDASKEVEELML